jgi:iron complex transport system ATP-binding protein
MLQVDNFSFRHSKEAQDIIHDISFSAGEGEITTVLGPNGSGKTTLFRCLVGLWRPQHGRMRFGDRELMHLSAHDRARLIAVVPQDHEAPFPYTVFDIVIMGRASHVALFSGPTDRDVAAAHYAIASVGIEHLSDRPYTKISGGERQLVLIARALAQQAPVLILDEPTSHLDFRNQVLVLETVRSIVLERGLTALMTLHDPNLALLFSDQALVLGAGQIMAKGKPKQVITADTLRAVYGIEVSVVNYNGTAFICPKVSHHSAGSTT